MRINNCLSMSNVVAVVFAHNERSALPLTLQILNRYKQEGFIQHIVVVNDGSIDRTSEIAKSAGAIVINHAQNMGKRMSFVSGATQARKLGAQILLTFDADIKKLPRETLRQMIGTVESGKKLMAIAQQHEVHVLDEPDEKSRVKDIHSNAQRAINMQALDPLFKEKTKWVEVMLTNKHKETPDLIEGEYRWGLEYALDKLIPSNKVVKLPNIVITAPAFREIKAKLQQSGARSLVQSVFSTRLATARKIREQRVRRK